MKQHNPLKILLSVSLAAIVLFTACADLKSIRSFADTSADSAGYTSLSGDYLKSIEREKLYQPESQHAHLENIIQMRKAQQPALLGLHKGISEYMSALGALASDETVSYDKSLDSLAGDIKKTKIIKDNEADAFISLTKFISKAATDLYRQKKLKQLISESNNDFQLVIAAMSGIVGTDLVSSLANESVAVDKYYKNIVTIAANAPPQQAAVELVNDKWKERQNELEAKKQACTLYAKTLEKIGKGHQLLFDNKDKLPSKQLLDSIKSYGKEVSAIYKQIKELK